MDGHGRDTARRATVCRYLVGADPAAVLGGFRNMLGRMDLAQVAITASEHRARVMTSERDPITHVLPKEWPIIDL